MGTSSNILPLGSPAGVSGPTDQASSQSPPPKKRTALRGSFVNHYEFLILCPFSLLEGTLEEQFRLGDNATKMYYAQKKDITDAKVVPRGSLDASLLPGAG